MRWKVLIGVITLVAGSVVFSIMYLDSFVKGKIEDIGSGVVGAKVSLESLDISLKKQSVTFLGLEVADPKAPMTNILELKSASFDFSLPDALMGHIFIENILVDTPMFGTKRKTSGALPKKAKPKEQPKGKVAKAVDKAAAKAKQKALEATGKAVAKEKQKVKQEFSADIDWKRYLPDIDPSKGVDPKQFVNKESMSSLKELDELSKFAKGRDRYWAERYKSLEEEFNSLKKTPNINQPKLIIAYRDKVNAFREKIDAAQKEFNADVDKINSAGKIIENLRNQDISKLVQLPQLGGGALGGISQKLFEDLYRKNMEKAYAVFEQYKTKLVALKGKEKEDEKKRMKGVTVHYPLKTPLPLFYLKKATFKTSAEQKRGNWFRGTLTEVSSDPKLTGKPAIFDMEGGSQDFPNAYFTIKGKADMTAKRDIFDIKMVGNGISTAMAANALGPDSPIAMTGGSVIFSSDLNLTGNLIKSGFLVKLDKIKMSARDEGLKGVDATVKKILNKSLEGVSYINLKGDAKGTIENLTVSITSDLDKILKSVFDKMLFEARKAIEKQIRDELNREIDKRLPGLRAMLTDDKGNLKNLDNLSGTITNRLDAEKKKLEKRARDEIKKQQDRVRAEIEKKKKELEKKKKEAEAKVKAEVEKKKKEQENRLRKEAEKKLRQLLKF